MNAFESGQRKVIPAVLIYARSEDQILMIHRNGNPGDYHSGKWNGLGGKCELDESPREAARRELKEEAGLELLPESFRPLGVIQFPNFKAHKSEDWIVFLFSVELESVLKTRVISRNSEGELHWVGASEVPSLNLWPGDRHFISWVISQKPFSGTIWYQGQEVLRAEISPFEFPEKSDTHRG